MSEQESRDEESVGDEQAGMDRRAAVKWMLSAIASVALLDQDAFGQTTDHVAAAKGYGVDPNLLKSYKPGELWPLVLTRAQLRTAATLCDVIIPAEGGTPSASALGVHEFINEWVSAPYPAHDRDRTSIVAGLVWIDEESVRRFGASFHSLSQARQHAICDDICYEPKATAPFKTAAAFFRRYRDLTAGGFYTTPAGMKDIGYVGNVALPEFKGPPKEVLRLLGL